MKSILATAILALSLNVMATTANSSWSSILASRNMDVQFPKISFLAGEATSFVSIDQVCHTETSIQTIKPQYIYSHTGKENGSSIVATGKAILTTGLTFKRYLPAGSGDHAELVAVEEVIPLSYRLEVRSVSNGDRDGHVLFTKTFNIPACN